jgi:hypothetical protein
MWRFSHHGLPAVQWLLIWPAVELGAMFLFFRGDGVGWGGVGCVCGGVSQEEDAKLALQSSLPGSMRPIVQQCCVDVGLTPWCSWLFHLYSSPVLCRVLIQLVIGSLSALLYQLVVCRNSLIEGSFDTCRAEGLCCGICALQRLIAWVMADVLCSVAGLLGIVGVCADVYAYYSDST